MSLKTTNRKKANSWIKEYIGEGLDLVKATENAKTGLVNTLGLKNDDDVKIEVICDFKKKTLGLFGGSMAKVKAFIELPDPKPEKKKTEKKAAPKAEKKPEKKAEKKEEKKEAPEIELNLIPAEKLAEGSSAAKAAAYIKTVMEGLGCENVTVSAAENSGVIYLQLDGDKLGVVIGRRGETLDALQYLTSLAANTGNGYQKVTLNIGNYREKREQTLISLAKRVSAQVLSSGRSRSLEPMNPYERRIIHTAVQEIEGVVSNSTGEGSNRRVVIMPENGDKRPPRRDDRRGGRRGDRRPSQTVSASADPNRAPKKDAPDLPLYGRIN
ncbi:MAG: RNA-binding cell elongation regulator Jag/EloR [Acutalibacteraceae bacterium]|nr:RNA-binding cell elongation regulator Jag/EloR [Acutalibacteraceae bacterium]